MIAFKIYTVLVMDDMMLYFAKTEICQQVDIILYL